MLRRSSNFTKPQPANVIKTPIPPDTSVNSSWRTAMFVTGLHCAIVTAVCFVLTSPPAAAQGITQPKQGQGGSVVKGAAGTDGSTGDKGLEHCDKPMGAMAVVEP